MRGKEGRERGKRRQGTWLVGRSYGCFPECLIHVPINGITRSKYTEGEVTERVQIMDSTQCTKQDYILRCAIRGPTMTKTTERSRSHCRGSGRQVLADGWRTSFVDPGDVLLEYRSTFRGLPTYAGGSTVTARTPNTNFKKRAWRNEPCLRLQNPPCYS